MNNKPEQELIDSFIKYMKKIHQNKFKALNCNCKSHDNPDIKYRLNNETWAIEAKSYGTKDSPNAIHKVFGELLKETGRNENTKIGLLIPKTGAEYFRKGFRRIKKEKYIGFGKLIPVSIVFVFDAENEALEKYSWEDFYNNNEG